MKFGKVLKVSSENMPEEMASLFLRYKELKKQIKAISSSTRGASAVAQEKQASASPGRSGTGTGSSGAAVTAPALSPEEAAFIGTLNEDLARFNSYFQDKEEEAVIRHAALCDELAAAAAAAGVPLPAALLADQGMEPIGPLQVSGGHEQEEGGPAPAAPAAQPAEAGERPCAEGASPGSEGTSGAPAAAEPASGSVQGHGRPPHNHHPHGHAHGHGHHSPSPASTLQSVRARLVQFHGEMVLLLHWSLLNYAAVVKILKKHDKATGVLLRAPYLANVLQQPFSSTTIMSRLARRAEELMVAATHLAPGAAGAAAAAAALAGAQAGAARGAQAPAQAAAAGLGARGAAPAAAAAVSASDASTLTYAAMGDAVAPPGAAEQPLVGSTMHALQTWDTLRKTAITPSTVLSSEAEQPGGRQAPKREADTPAAEGEAAAAEPAAKAARTEDA